MSTVYEWLIVGDRDGGLDPFDRHVFACLLAAGVGEPERRLTEALGLTRLQLQALIGRYFPAALWLLAGLPADDDGGETSIEEEDLRDLLLRHRSCGRVEEDWLAAMVARRALQPVHPLWQDLGLHSRTDLSALLLRNFRGFAQKNTEDAIRPLPLAG